MEIEGRRRKMEAKGKGKEERGKRRKKKEKKEKEGKRRKRRKKKEKGKRENLFRWLSTLLTLILTKFDSLVKQLFEMLFLTISV